MNEEKDDEKSYLNAGLENKALSSKEKGLSRFFVESEKYSIYQAYFHNKIPSKYINNLSLSESILHLRNRLIILTILEIFASIWGLSYYFIRKSLIYVFINTAAFFISLIGLFSVIYIYEIGLLFYTLLTTALPGTFFIYEIFEVVELKSNSHDKSLNDTYMLLIFSIPYLYDLIVGIVSYMFVYKISNFNEIMRQSNKNDLEKVQKEIDFLKANFSDNKDSVLHVNNR
jgi:hypothetical protein